MKSLIDRYGLALQRVVLCFLALVYGAWLVGDEWVFRRGLPTAPAAVVAQARPDSAQGPLNHAAVATVMGFITQGALARSAEPLQLRASFVASSGASRALLAGTEGQRIYRVGDSLPSGSVLRRIEVGRVVLWRNGREELLPLEQPARQTLQAIQATGPAVRAEPSPLYLRPTASQHQSE